MLSKKIYNKLKKFYKKKREELHEPYFSEHENLEIKKCLKSTFVSTAGNNTNRFENKIKLITKSKYSVAVVNATTGIFVSLKALNINSHFFVCDLLELDSIETLINQIENELQASITAEISDSFMTGLIGKLRTS